MARRVRVLLLIPHLGGGGAEHVMALLARGLSPQKFDLHIGLVTQTSSACHELPGHVIVHPLGARRVRTGALSLLRLVWKLRPEVVFSTMAHLNFLVLLLRVFFPRKTRVLIRQNATVSSTLSARGLPWYTQGLYQLLYPRADLLICQTQAMAVDLARLIKIAPERLTVLSSPVDFEGIRAAAELPACRKGSGPHLMAVGRLVSEKGFDLLLEALARIRARHPNADLVIAGEGPLRPCLEIQSMCMGLRCAVRFVGYLEHPYELFSGADLFVLSSRNEGMPNALLEAAAAGLPLVATPASGGLTDMLCGQPGVWITTEISAESLARSLIDALGVLEPGQRFQHSFLLPPGAATHAYEEAIESVISQTLSPEFTQV